MKITLLFSIMFAVCAALFFFAPHHRREPESFRPSTLGQVYRKFWADMPSTLTAERQVFLLVGLAGMLASFYPALLVLLVYWLRPVARNPGAVWFILLGFIACAGVAANFLAMMISHMNFAFGGRAGEKTATFYVWLVPLFQGVFAIASILIGFSGRCAGWADHLLSQ